MILQFIHQVLNLHFLIVIDHCFFLFAQQCAVMHCRGSSELFISGTCFITNKNRLLLKEMGNPYQHDADSL